MVEDKDKGMKRIAKENITVQLLESRVMKLSEEVTKYQNLFDKMQEQQIMKGMTDYQKQGVLGAIFSKTISSKNQLIGAVDKIKDTAICSGILDVVLTDALSPNIQTGDILTLTSENKPIEKALKQLQDNIDLDALVLDIAEDLVSYGEYFLGAKTEEGKGVTEVVDDVDQSEMVALYKNSFPVGYLKMGDRKIEVKQPNEYVHFCMGRSRKRIRLQGLNIKKGNISEYVRVGRSLFQGVFSEVNDLNLLKSLIPATYVQKINATTVIGVSMPESTDPEMAWKTCRKYEKVLNKLVAFDSTNGTVTAADVLNQAGKFKVVPIMSGGSGDKGRLEKMDPRFDDMMDPSLLQELKKDIFGSIGVPYNFVYGGDIPKADTLKQFARYVRKILLVQMAVRFGIVQLATIHLKALNLKPADSHIIVKFTNALISVDDLDAIEFLDMLLTTLGNTVTTLQNIQNATQSSMDNKILGDFLGRFMSIVNLDKLFKMKPGEIKPIAPEEPLPVEQ